MPPADAKQYEVTLGEQFVTHLKEPVGSRPADRHGGFAIRYSVPPESVQTNQSPLNLRKNNRGEYIIENSQPQAPDAPPISNSQASFKGTGTQTRDTDCVLVYNPKIGKYELQMLRMDIQVTPVLKSRLRSQATPSSSQASADHGVFLRDRPASSRPASKSSSPVKPAPPRGPSQKAAASKAASTKIAATKPSTSRASTPRSAASRASTPVAVSSIASSESTSIPVSSNGTSPVAAASTPALTPKLTKATSATLAPRTTTKARLPTRKKITSKIAVSKLRSAGDDIGDGKATTPEISRNSRIPSAEPPENPLVPVHRDRDTNSTYDRLRQPGEQYFPPASQTASQAEPKTEVEAPPAADGFDDSFNDLADELADELGDDDDENDNNNNNNNNNNETPQRATWSTGTAGTVEDEEDASSEEE